ncbi:MAG: YafY family transcriptional regulator [Ruminococcus sp.]|nr:YafY family transcriptional regulator [Ruminococcus sp.]
MRTDRLYAITVYLMNHGKASASELAKHFEVSVRTIQRDIDSLCQAGIPVIALNGVNGGYQIAEQFMLNNQLVSQDESAYILTALKGLSSVSGNLHLTDIYEKFSAMSNGAQTGMILDFSVLREGDEKLLTDLQKAVREKSPVQFLYTNNSGETRRHIVEPIAVMYQWYAWYLLAYCVGKEDYRTYKLVRMEDMELLEGTFSKEHPAAEAVLCEHNLQSKKFYGQSKTEMKVKCRSEAVYRLKEYLHGQVVEELPDKSAIMRLTVVEEEQWWIGMLLSLGDAVEVISPSHIREHVVTQAEKILKLYRNI